MFLRRQAWFSGVAKHDGINMTQLCAKESLSNELENQWKFVLFTEIYEWRNQRSVAKSNFLLYFIQRSFLILINLSHNQNVLIFSLSSYVVLFFEDILESNSKFSNIWQKLM